MMDYYNNQILEEARCEKITTPIYNAKIKNILYQTRGPGDTQYGPGSKGDVREAVSKAGCPQYYP